MHPYLLDTMTKVVGVFHSKLFIKLELLFLLQTLESSLKRKSFVQSLDSYSTSEVRHGSGMYGGVFASPTSLCCRPVRGKNKARSASGRQGPIWA